jgi:alkylation response protein AidB-like acyl-CoA dehydrogenase
MLFAVTDEQDLLRQSVRDFLAATSPMTEVRRLMETGSGYDPAVWAQLAGGLGLTGLTIPAEYGGTGAGFGELAIVCEEMGRALYCGPYFASAVVAASAIQTAATPERKQELLPAIAAGEVIATLAVAEDDGRFEQAAISLRARRDKDDYQLHGHKSFVLDGALADVIVVAGRLDGELALFTVDGGAPGLDRTVLPTLDMTRKLARLEFSGVQARLLCPPGPAAEALARTLDLAVIALAAEQVGGSQRCLDMSVEYAKNRFQFGRPIGSFQAIKHKCADMLLDVESARSAAYFAAWAAADSSPELPAVASLAKAYCSEAFFRTAGQNIQIHGGIGFTWEHDAHLYFKRAKSAELLFGDPVYHREQLVQRIGV